MASIDPGDPKLVQIIMYTIFRNDKGYYYMRNQQNDYVTTRIEGKTWKGSQEQHFYNPYTGTTYKSPADFKKAFPNSKFVDEPLGDKLSRSAHATATVVKTAWNNSESQAVLVVPVFALVEILATGTVVEPIIFGKIKNFEKISSYGIEEAVRNKHGIKVIAEGGKEMAAYVYQQLLKEGYKSTLKSSGNSIYYQLEKGGEKIFFRQSKSGNYSGFDTFVKPLGNKKNSTILFK